MRPRWHSFAVALVLSLVLVGPALAQFPSALLIGNGTYTNPVWNNLSCIPTDIQNMTTQLTGCQWQVSSAQNQTAAQMRGLVQTDIPAVPNSEWIFYYTGHGDNTAGYSGGLAGVTDNGSGSDLYYPSPFAADMTSVGHPLFRYIILDSCGSGGFAKLANLFLQTKAVSALFLAATDDSLNCAQCTGAANGSAMTYWINRGLQGPADGCGGNPANGVITWNELDCYLTANYDNQAGNPPHLYIPNGLGTNGICTVRPVASTTRSWGTIKAMYR